MTGQVNDRREPVVTLTVFGFGGNSVSVDAIVDTGFDDYLTLPLETIATLALSASESMPVMLADGSIINSLFFDAEVEWNNTVRSISVQSAPGPPLIGMRLLEGSRLIIDVTLGGPVQILPLQ